MATKNTEPKEGYVKLTLPRARVNEDPNLYVAINGYTYLIPKGKTSEVPAFVADEVHRSQEAMERFYATSDELLERAKQQ